MRVLCFGLTAYNIICRVDTFPVKGNKYIIKEKTSNGGGFAFDAAYLLASWGIDTFIAGVVGSDENGSKIRKELQQANVNVDYLETSYDKPTSSRLVLVDAQDGIYTPIDLSPQKAVIKKEGWPINPDLILGDSSQYHAFLSAINANPNKLNFVFADIVDLETLELCKYGKYIIASSEFAQQVTKISIDFNNPNTLVELYNRFLHKYPHSQAIITLGSNGAMYAKDKKVNLIQGLKTKAVDCTGAGNVFRGAFVYGIAVGYDIEKCVQIANIAAGLSVEKFGSKISIPALNDVLAYYNKKFGVGSNPAPVGNPTGQPNNAPAAQKVVENKANEQQVKKPEPVKQAQPVQPPQNQNQKNTQTDVKTNMNNINNPGINPPARPE